MELPKPSHRQDFASQIDDLISNGGYDQHCRCADAASIRNGIVKKPPFSASPTESSKVLHASEFNPVETVNECINPSSSVRSKHPSSSIQEKIHRGIVLASQLQSLLCFDYTEERRMCSGEACASNKDALLVLVLFVTVLAAPSMHQHHLFWSNLTEERSEKPRSSSAPATNNSSDNNSSDKTTRAPKANKLSNDEAKNHSDPNSFVTERDRIEEAKRTDEWYVATGAAHHATGNSDLITNLVELENNSLCVHAADGTPMPVLGRGNVVTEDIVLSDVFYVPGLRTNLVSVGQLASMDYCVGFGRGACVVSDAAGTVVGRAHATGDGMYVTDFLRVQLGSTP